MSRYNQCESCQYCDLVNDECVSDNPKAVFYQKDIDLFTDTSECDGFEKDKDR